MPNMDVDCKRTEVTLSSLAKRVQDLQKENEKLRTASHAIYQLNDELYTKSMDVTRTLQIKSEKGKPIASLARFCYAFRTVLENNQLGKEGGDYVESNWSCCHTGMEQMMINQRRRTGLLT